MRDKMLRHYAEFQQLLADYYGRIPDDAWQNRTESRPQGWTLHQTLAHLVAAGEGYQTMVNQRLAGEPYHIPGLEKRTDLPIWNAQQIAALGRVPSPELVTRLLNVFATAHDQITELPDNAFDMDIPLPMYNRPGMVADIFGWQCCHVGIVHAAQIANGAHCEPLWRHYDPALFQWIITQFVNQFAHSYWPERGGDLKATVNLIIGGDHGGRWHVVLNPDGGMGYTGSANPAALTLRFRNADIFCKAYTLQLTPMRALLTGQIFATGNLRLGFRLPYLLNPT
jgi:hypothetical protein